METIICTKYFAEVVVKPQFSSVIIFGNTHAPKNRQIRNPRGIAAGGQGTVYVPSVTTLQPRMFSDRSST